MDVVVLIESDVLGVVCRVRVRIRVRVQAQGESMEISLQKNGSRTRANAVGQFSL